MTSRATMVLLGIAGLLGSVAAHGQEQIIERCKQTSSKDDRIACLEAALLMRDGGPVAETVLEANPVQAVPAVPEVDAGSDTTQTPVEPSDRVVDVVPAEPTDIVAEAVADSPPSEPTGIGAEQVIARQQTQEEMLAALERVEGLTVSKYESLPHGRLQVRLENGQVWRQIRGDTQNVRVSLRTNQTVNIEESSLGGYKLRLNEIRRTIRVQRIR